MVTLYKLAEQIIQDEKRVHVPSYYEIFKAKDIVFDSVEVDSQYDREDRQPDVIGKTADGKQYLIEFKFKDKVKYLEKNDYHNLNILEIDLSDQTFETLRGFLLHSENDRRWLNHHDYFNQIELVYKTSGREVQVMEVSECKQCRLMHSCCGVRYRKDHSLIEIENNGREYRICKRNERDRKFKVIQSEEEVRSDMEIGDDRIVQQNGERTS